MGVAAAAVAVSVVAVLMSRSQTPDGSALVYPGAETVVDLKGEEGSTLHLRTRDSFDEVLRWYVENLKPTKTMRISETSVILKAAGRTVTIVAEGDAVNVVIKQAA
jgi:hypothetical protein